MTSQQLGASPSLGGGEEVDDRHVAFTGLDDQRSDEPAYPELFQPISIVKLQLASGRNRGRCQGRGDATAPAIPCPGRGESLAEQASA